MPDTTDLTVTAESGKGDVNTDTKATQLSDKAEDVTGTNHRRERFWRHGRRHHHHPEWKENMPAPSGDGISSELTPEQLERYARYAKWEKYYSQKYPSEEFPGGPDMKGVEGEHRGDKFHGGLPGDPSFGPPFPHPYRHNHFHNHHFYCGGRFHHLGPKPTLQERLQREFDFV